MATNELERIEEAYGDSKMRKLNSLIEAYIKTHSLDEFQAAARNFFSLDLPESDRTLYNVILDKYQGHPTGQYGGRCRYDAGQQRCYSSIGDQVDPTCIATTGFKGNKSCRRNPNVPIYNVVGPSKKAFQAATKRTKAQEAAEWEDIEKIVKGIQVGGRCRYDAGQQRCYSSIGDQVDPTCIATTGFKGNKSCRRNPNVPIYNVVGPSKKAFQAATKRTKAQEPQNGQTLKKW